MDRRVVENLRLLPERNRFFKGLFAWVGFRRTEVLYQREARSAGQTKWSFWKLWNFAIDGITAFSTMPLRIWTYLGLSVAAVSFALAFFLVLRAVFWEVDVPGFATLLVVVLILGGLQLMALGIIGEYLGRTYVEVKQRPLYLVRGTAGFGVPENGGQGDEGEPGRSTAEADGEKAKPGAEVTAWRQQ
jgi:glycosyltransferase involved in cell wall biosynthesis